MPKRLTKLIASQRQAESLQFVGALMALSELLPDLTPDELAAQDRYYQQHDDLKKQRAKAWVELSKVKDPEEYLGRLEASMEREHEQMKTIVHGLNELVRNHKKAVEEWLRKNPPSRRKPAKRSGRFRNSGL